MNIEDSLLTCVHCGFCLPACPTYVRLGDEADSPRGRLHLMRAVAEGRLAADSDAFATHLDRCLGCRACEPVCPSGVPYGRLLEQGREAVRAVRALPARMRVLLWLFERPRASRVVLAVARVVRATGVPALLARVLPFRAALPLAMLAASAPHHGAGVTSAAAATDRDRGDAQPLRVGVLTGCVQEGLFGRVNQATARTLRANGYEVVEVDGQGCCGALHAHAGDLEGARRLARRNVRAFEGAGLDRVCVNAAGCGAMLKEYDHLLAGEDEGLSARTRDVAELLAERDIRKGGEVAMSVAYDAPCHLLHAQGVDEAVQKVFEAIPGVVRLAVEGADACCGGAGLYGMAQPELGKAIGRDKADQIRATGADAVATGNPGCMMQIGALLRIEGEAARVVHPIELLDESYRRAGFYDGER